LKQLHEEVGDDIQRDTKPSREAEVNLHTICAKCRTNMLNMAMAVNAMGTVSSFLRITVKVKNVMMDTDIGATLHLRLLMKNVMDIGVDLLTATRT